MNVFETCALPEFEYDAPSNIGRKEDSDWSSLAVDYRTLKLQIKFLEKQMEEVKNKLIGMADKDICIGGGIELQKIVKKGNIDYSKIDELQFVDVEKFGKPSTEYWKINEV